MRTRFDWKSARVQIASDTLPLELRDLARVAEIVDMRNRIIHMVFNGSLSGAHLRDILA